MWVETVISKSGTIKYKFNERYTCPYSGKYKRVSVTYTTNSRQAYKDAHAELLSKISKATDTTTKHMTLSQLILEYLECKRDFRKITTQKAQDFLYKTLIDWFPTDMLIENINTFILQSTLDKFAKQYSYNYTKAGLSLIRQSFKYAQRMEYITNISFLDNIELQRPIMDVEQIKKQRTKFLTKDELKKLLSLLDEKYHHVSLLCEFQSLTGLRFGEMVALRIQDYNPSTSEIDINATLTMVGSLKSPAIRVPPKNVHSIRKIKLDERATQIINHFITANKARKLWKQNFPSTDYIFITNGGLPYDLRYVNKVIKKIGFFKPVSTHTFRHTHISLLAESNVPLKAIMERVGHNEPRTTLAIYTHVTDEMKKELNNAITNIGNSISQK